MSINNFKVSVNGDGKKMMNTPVTFEMVVNHVKRMGLEDNVTRAILNKARTLPPGSLQHFVNNINNYIVNLTRETHHDKNQQA